MADNGPGPEGHGQQASTNGKAFHSIEIHRVNDYLFGHVGQVSYRPMDDEESDIGELAFSRITEHLPSFQQLLPLERWFSPTMTIFNPPSSKTFQTTRSQRNWLLKFQPEAFLGNPDLQGLLSEQLRAARSHDTRGESQITSVLAIGAIADSRNSRSSRVVSWPVVAMAAGEAGNILRLTAIHLTKWTWNQFSLPIGAAPSSFHGSWNSDGTPISQIKFATKLKQYDPIRWLVAQKETSTTIFEPEIKARPVANSASGLGLENESVDHIAMNSIVTLTPEATGGDAHCDFSVNLGEDEDAPQIAIIDRSGNWSVWYIERDGHGRSRTSKAVPRAKGTLEIPASVWPSNQTDPLGKRHRIAWVGQSRKADEWERDSNPSDNPSRSSSALHAAYLAGLDMSHSRYDMLLICNSTQVQILTVNGAQKLTWLDLSRRDGIDIMLDAQTKCGSSSHVLVLTTAKLYLLDVAEVEGQEASCPTVLASCPHYRNHAQETLKMSVMKLRPSRDKATSLVFLYSAQSCRVSLFWFTISQQDGNAHFHHQAVQFPGLKASASASGHLQGIESLMVVPLQLSGPNSEETANYTTEDGVQLYQLFALLTDLSLHSSVVAITTSATQTLARPIKSASTGWDDARRERFLQKKLLRESENAFVLPDADEEDKQLSAVNLPNRVASRDTVQLRYFLIRLVEEINRGFFGEGLPESAGDSIAELFTPIRHALEDRDEDDHISLKPLLSYSDCWRPLDLTKVEIQCDVDFRQLQKSEAAQLLECGWYGSKLNIADLFEKLSINWSARLPAESLRATQWRYIELALEKMAAEVYLSQKGIAMVPQSTRELAAKVLPSTGNIRIKVEDDPYERPLSQPRSDISLPTASATPSSSRATSEAAENFNKEQEDDVTGQEDGAVARLRMYLPSVKFTPPAKGGPSRILSLWPEQRGSDPAQYRYSPTGRSPDAEVEAAKRREERRLQRKAERKAQLGIKLEGAGDSSSQPFAPTVIQSSPPPQIFGSSQVQSQGFGYGHGFGGHIQGQGQSQGSGFSQIMSQPLPGEFGARRSRPIKKPKVKKLTIGFR